MMAMKTSPEIEKLMEERKRIDNQIKLLRKGTPVVMGRAKLDVETYPTNRPDRHYVAVMSSHPDTWYRERPRWRSVISADSREDAIQQIPDVIRDLQNLYDAVITEDGKE